MERYRYLERDGELIWKSLREIENIEKGYGKVHFDSKHTCQFYWDDQLFRKCKEPNNPSQNFTSKS